MLPPKIRYYKCDSCSREYKQLPIEGLHTVCTKCFDIYPAELKANSDVIELANNKCKKCNGKIKFFVAKCPKCGKKMKYRI